MYCKSLAWKAFNVDIPTVDAWIRSEFESYAGSSADTHLHLWFSETLEEVELEAIDSYWTALTEESDEAVNYLPHSTLVAAIEALRADIVEKSWDEMSTAERKLVVGGAITRQDLGL